MVLRVMLATKTEQNVSRASAKQLIMSAAKCYFNGGS